MSTTRSATHTIAGYHYQFDKSIIEILNSKKDVPIVLEGIEDIDIEGEFIQCKYHSSQKYTPSKIKSPLLAFANHFAESRGNTIYTLYAHFREGRLPDALTSSELKLILGSALNELSLDEDGLCNFATSNLRLVPADDIESQWLQTIESICKSLICSKDEAIEYYYGNALHEIMRLSRQKEASLRTITRGDFIVAINRKLRLYSIWTQQLAGEKEYHAYVRKKLKSHNALSSTKSKMFFFNDTLVSNSGLTGVLTLCEFLVDRFFKVGHSLIPAFPPTVVIDGAKDFVISLKHRLLEKHIVFNDGFEHMDFQPWVFNKDPVVNRLPMRNGRPTDKIGVASYQIRLISRDSYQKAFSQLKPSDVVFSLGTDPDTKFSEYCDVIHLHPVNSYEMMIAILNQ